MTRPAAVLAALAALLVAGCGGGDGPGPRAGTAQTPTATASGAAPERPARRRGAAARPAAGRIPPLLDPRDVYAAGRPGRLSLVVRKDPARVYVPNSKSDTVDAISQRTGQVIDHFATGGLPPHVTPSWDLRTLWVTNDTGNSLTPIDPRTGRHGRRVAVTDPYNLYFTADGRRAIVVAEAHKELDFREPHTTRLRRVLRVPQCAGVDHIGATTPRFTRSARAPAGCCDGSRSGRARTGWPCGRSPAGIRSATRGSCAEARG